MRPAGDANFSFADEYAIGKSSVKSPFEGDLERNFTLSRFHYLLEQIAAVLNVYYTPLLIFFGCIGNLASLFVFYTSKLRLQSTAIYLSALAISDTLFLVQLLPPWLDSIHLSIVFYQPGFCQITVYLSYVTCCLSTWIVVAFTIERFVAVLYPLQRTVLCTVNRAKYIMFALTGITLVLNLPVLKFASPSKDACSIDSEYLEHAARFNLVDTMVAFTVPLAAIIILNFRIMVGVYRLERTRHHLMKAERRPGSGVQIAPLSALRSQQRVTRMLLIVSSVFVVLNLPAYTMRVLAYTYDRNSAANGVRWAAFQQLALTCFHTNFGINFMLYCLSGQNFRRVLCQTIPCLRRPPLGMQRTNARRINCHPNRASSISTSYVSGGNEVANNIALCTINAEGTRTVRRQRSDSVIKRWTFDNSRHRNVREEPVVEMETYNVGAGTEHST